MLAISHFRRVQGGEPQEKDEEVQISSFEFNN